MGLSYSFPPNAFSWLEFPDLHGALGVDRDRIEKFAALVQTWHPDKATRYGIDHYSANIITRVINHAGEILGDNKTRKKYETNSLSTHTCACELCLHCVG